jgi:hypothetical protein
MEVKIVGIRKKTIKIKEAEYKGDIKNKYAKVIFSNEKGCVVRGYIKADDIESKGPLTSINIRAHGCISVKGYLKSKQFIIAEGPIMAYGPVIAGWSLYSGVWIRAKGCIRAKKGSISAEEYIMSNGYIRAHSWVTCKKKIEAGYSIWANKYIKAPEICAGAKSDGDFYKQIIRAKRVSGEVVSGTVIKRILFQKVKT